jgi:muconolactone delta-isomerase
MPKKFDKALYAENDKKAKECSLEFLLQSKLFELKIPLAEQKEAYKKYDFEVFHKKEKRPVYIETEVKRVWKKSGEWEGYTTIDVPKRKEKTEKTP